MSGVSHVMGQAVCMLRVAAQHIPLSTRESHLRHVSNVTWKCGLNLNCRIIIRYWKAG